MPGGDGPEDRDDTKDTSLDISMSWWCRFSDTGFMGMDQDARGGLSEQMDEIDKPDDGAEWHRFTSDEEHAELMDECSGDAQMNVKGNGCDKDLEKSVEERGIENRCITLTLLAYSYWLYSM